MKGVSTILTSALLIVFALAVAAVYSGWLINFTRTTTKDVSEYSDKRIECSYGGIALSNLEYNATSGNLTGNVENIDIIPLGNIDLEIFYDNATKQKMDLNKELEPGETDVFNIDISNNYERIRTLTNCSNVNDEVSSSSISQV